MENVLVAGAGLGLTIGGSWRQVSVGRNSSALLTVVPEPAHVIQQHRTMYTCCAHVNFLSLVLHQLCEP